MLVVPVLIALSIVAYVQWRACSRETRAQSEFPPSGQIIDVQGTPIHVLVTGTGPDLVLIHGANGSLRDFTFDLVDRLKKRYRVIAVDRPGLGWSKRGPGYGGVWNVAPEPPAVQARLLQAAVDAVGAKRPIVVGHSFGGAIALAWALERPDDTAALVLLGAVSNPWPGGLGALYRINASVFGSVVAIPLITALTPHHRIKDTVEVIFEPQAMPQGYLDHIGPEMSLRRPALRANAQQVNNLRPYIVEMTQHYTSLTLPVEILHGTADTIVPLHIHAEPLAAMLPNAVLTRLEGVGHMPHHAAPEKIVAAIDRAAARADLR